MSRGNRVPFQLILEAPVPTAIQHNSEVHGLCKVDQWLRLRRSCEPVVCNNPARSEFCSIANCLLLVR